MNNFKNRHLLLSSATASTVTYTIDKLDQVIQIDLSNYTGSTASNAVELTLPDLSQTPEIGYDWRLMVVDSSTDSGGKTVEIFSAGSDTIDGTASYVHTFSDSNTDAFFVEYADSDLWTIMKSGSDVVMEGTGCIMGYTFGDYTQNGAIGVTGGILFGLNYTTNDGDNWENWLDSFNSFNVKFKDTTTGAYSGFLLTNVTHESGSHLTGIIDWSTFVESGDFASSENICVDITPSDVSSDVTCFDSSTVVDFGTTASYATTINAPVGLGLGSTNSQVVVYNTADAENLVVIQVSSYVEDYDIMSATISGTVSANVGSGTASQLCFIPQNGGSANSGYLYEKTLFVDPNGNDELAANFLIGGSKNQPFKTIQAAMTYASQNYTNEHAINVHVFAGVYTVSNENPIVFPNQRPHTNLHLDDGVRINDFENNDQLNTTYDDRGHLIKMQGRCSITGQGMISMIGASGIHLDVIYITNSADEADIQLKRINMNSNGLSSGYAIYRENAGAKNSIAKFDGEIKIGNDNNGILLTNSDSGIDDSFFVFSDDCIFDVDSTSVSTSLITSYDSSETGNLAGSTTIYLRGKCRVYSNQTTGSISVIYIDVNDSSTAALNCVFDGFECSVATNQDPQPAHYLIDNDASLDSITFSTLSKSTTNCYLDQSNTTFTNETTGVLSLGVSNLRLPKLTS